MGLGDTRRRVPALQTWTWQNVAIAFVLRPSHGLRQWLPRSDCCSCGLSHIHPCVSAPTSLSAQPVIATLPPSHHSLGGEQSGFLSKLHVLSQPHTSLGATNSPSKRRGVKSFGFYLFLLQGTKVRLVCLSLRLVAVWRTLSSTVCFNTPDSQCLECSLCKLICRKYTWVYCRAKIVNGICKVA